MTRPLAEPDEAGTLSWHDFRIRQLERRPDLPGHTHPIVSATWGRHEDMTSQADPYGIVGQLFHNDGTADDDDSPYYSKFLQAGGPFDATTVGITIELPGVYLVEYKGTARFTSAALARTPTDAYLLMLGTGDGATPADYDPLTFSVVIYDERFVSGDHNTTQGLTDNSLLDATDTYDYSFTMHYKVNVENSFTLIPAVWINSDSAAFDPDNDLTEILMNVTISRIYDPYFIPG